jgi:hypothetical protein
MLRGTQAVLLLVCCFVHDARADLTRKADSGLVFTAANGEMVIATVQSGQNAARDGLQKGDVVLQVNGRRVLPEAKFARELMRRTAGDRVDFLVRREGREMHVTVEYRPAPMEHPDGIDVQYRSVETDGHLRRLLVAVPKHQGRIPAVLWIAGSGCGSQEAPEGSQLVDFLYRLGRRGYVTVRVEKSGVGDRIYLFAHSAGTTLAPLVAQQAATSGIVAAGAMGTSFFDYVYAMRRRELELSGKSPTETDAEMKLNRTCTERLLRDRKTPDEIEAENPDCRHRVRYDSPPPYIQDLADVDLKKVWQEAPNRPVLVLYGSGDFVTNEHESRSLADTINQVHPKEATLRILPMEHGLLAIPSQQDAWNAEHGRGPRGSLYVELVNIVDQFFRKCGAISR